MTTREITIPPAVRLVIGTQPYAFARFVEHLVATCPQFATRLGMYAGGRILAAVLDKAEGEKCQVREEDARLLDVAIDNPAMGYLPPGLYTTGPDGAPVPAITSPQTFRWYIEAVTPPPKDAT